MRGDRARHLRPVDTMTGFATTPPTPEELMARVARGDEAAFSELYDLMAPQVFGVIRRVLRDPAQSEEVAQEVLVQVWRMATRFDPSRGSAATWIMTIAHRRAVDRVRSTQAAFDREQRVASTQGTTPFDDVVEQVTSKLEREQVRNCLSALTELQHQAVTLAYYSGYTYREVSELLDVNLATVKSRMRDGLVRLRDCLGAQPQPRMGGAR